MNHITRFRGEHRFLSNFYEAPFEYEGVRYPTVEHAYQERKTTDPARRLVIRSASTAMDAARLGRAKETVLRADWLIGDTKRDVMEPLVQSKFVQNPDLAKLLLATGDAFLMEGNYWHDNYFGSCSCQKCHEAGEGKNHLGKILMAVRAALAKSKPDATADPAGDMAADLDAMKGWPKSDPGARCPNCGRTWDEHPDTPTFGGTTKSCNPPKPKKGG